MVRALDVSQVFRSSTGYSHCVVCYSPPRRINVNVMFAEYPAME